MKILETSNHSLYTEESIPAKRFSNVPSAISSFPIEVTLEDIKKSIQERSRFNVPSATSSFPIKVTSFHTKESILEINRTSVTTAISNLERKCLSRSIQFCPCKSLRLLRLYMWNNTANKETHISSALIVTWAWNLVMQSYGNIVP